MSYKVMLTLKIVYLINSMPGSLKALALMSSVFLFAMFK